MNEIAIRKTAFHHRGRSSRCWRPAGSAVHAVTDEQCKRKFVETVCDLASPAKRGRFGRVAGIEIMAGWWTPRLRDEWRAWGREGQPADEMLAELARMLPLNELPAAGRGCRARGADH